MRLGGIAEIQKKLVELPERATREKKSFFAGRALGGALADVNDRHQIGDDDEEINEVQAAKNSHKGSGRN